MLKNWTLAFLVLALTACSDTSSRYRDTHLLELPPELSIEHSRAQAAIVKDEMKPKVSALAGLMIFEDDGEKPVLTLKTRPDRAWDMVVVALKISNIEVLDKNREENRIQVRFDPDSAGKEESVFDIFSSDTYPEAEYDIRLKEQADGVGVNAALSKPGQLEPAEDASAELIRFLHKVIDEKIINRNRNNSPAE